MKFMQRPQAGQKYLEAAQARLVAVGLIVMALVMATLQLVGVAAAPQASAQSCTAIPQEDDLVAWWSFNDTFTDETGTYTGVPENGATLTSGYVGPSLELTANSAVKFDDANLALDDTNGGFSVDMWVRTDTATSGSEALIDHRDSSSGSEGFLLFLYDQGRPHIQLHNGTTWKNYGAPTLVVPDDGEFHLLTYVVTSEGDVTFYVDEASETISTGNAGSRNAPDAIMSIGANIEGSSNHFDGILDEIEIFNTLLAEEDVRMLLEAGTAGKCGLTPPLVCTTIPQEESLLAWWTFNEDYWDETGSYVGVPNAGATIGSDGYVGNGLDVTANSQVTVQSIDLGLDETGGDFSVDMWVRTDTTSSDVETLLDHRQASSGDGTAGFSLFLYGGGRPHIQLSNGATAFNYGASALTVPADGEFHLITWVVAADGAVTFYVDNNSETVTTGLNGPRDGNGSVMSFGTNIDDNINYFDGYLDEIEIFNTLLTAEDVATLVAARDAGKCGLTTPPVTTLVNLPDNVQFGPTNEDGTSVIFGDVATELLYEGCPGGTVTYEFRLGTVNGVAGALLSSGTLTETVPGLYETIVPPTQPLWGDATLTITVVCPEGDGEVIVGDVYIDPSGLILNQLGHVIEGATVELLRSDAAAGPFTMVPDGSSIMSPANRTNPVVTGADGYYRWDTVPGFYKTRATAPGCVNPVDGSASVESAVLPVPPIQVDIDLVLECVVDITCEGVAVTIDLSAAKPGAPTEEADVILGTDGPDVIDGLGGDDIICGGLGDDFITGSAGDDKIYGEGGDDTIDGGDGNDKLFGRQGKDTMSGGDGDDTLHGNRGDDVLHGDGGDDRIFGYAHNDTIDGGDGNDRLHGNFGDDVITGGLGNDAIFGYGDSDTLSGGTGDDLISGNFGDDIINGGDGNDTLFGADGDDTVNGDAGDDIVNGNSLNDTLSGGTGDDTLDGGINVDTCDGGPGTDTAGRCETIIDVP